MFFFLNKIITIIIIMADSEIVILRDSQDLEGSVSMGFLFALVGGAKTGWYLKLSESRWISGKSGWHGGIMHWLSSMLTNAL